MGKKRINMRKIRKDTLPDVTKLVMTITNGRNRFKIKKMYCFQGDDTPDGLKRDADAFIDAVLTGNSDSLNDESISHRQLNRKVYLRDKEY